MIRASCVFAICLLATATARAGFTTAVTPWQTVHQGDVIRFSRGPDSGPGGEFVVYGTIPNPQKPSQLMQGKSLLDTFCLEKNEYLNFSDNFVVGGLSREARNGGLGGQNSTGIADPLDPRTAYLFEQFYYQRLLGYQYLNSVLRSASADQLQNALWFLENEISAKNPCGKALGYSYDPTDMDIAAKTLGKDSRAYQWVFEAEKAVENGTHIGDHVRVINLLDSKGGRSQDLLTVATPEPSSIVVWGVLLGIGAYWGWKRVRPNKRDHSLQVSPRSH